MLNEIMAAAVAHDERHCIQKSECLTIYNVMFIVARPQSKIISLIYSVVIFSLAFVCRVGRVGTSFFVEHLLSVAVVRCHEQRESMRVTRLQHATNVDI